MVKNKALDINKMVDFMKKVAKNDKHGYDQIHRTGNPDYDCSGLVATALKKAGMKIEPADVWTGNLENYLVKNGFKKCKKPWKRGDIHLAIGHHVAVSTSKSKIVHASINEKGKATGGKAGDQTGKEICIRNYYEYPWDVHYRYTKPTVVKMKNKLVKGSEKRWQ